MDARLRVLQRVAEGVRRAPDVDSLVTPALEALAGLTGDEFAALHVRSVDGAWLNLREERGLSALGAVTDRVSAREGPIGSVATTGTALHVARAPDDHGLLAAPATGRGAVRRGKIHGFLCVPLSRGGRTLGTLSLGRRIPAPFDDGDRALLEAVAGQLALALDGPRREPESSEHARLESEPPRRDPDFEGARIQLCRAGRLAAVGDLAGSLAHEANNPLTTILGQAHLLSMRSDLSDHVRDRLTIVAAEAARAAQLIQNMLVFAREYPPERHLCSPAEPMRQVLEIAAYQLRHDGIRVVAELGDCPPVSGDESQLRQVLLALVEAARHAMRGRQGERVLTVRTGRSERGVYVEVLHTGESPPPETSEDALDPLGLIARIAAGPELLAASFIVMEHGGRMRSTPRPDGGAITVEFPSAEARGS